MNTLPEEIILSKNNSFKFMKGNLLVKLYKKKNKEWPNFIDPSLLDEHESEFEIKSSQSDISAEFFEEIDDEELKKQMDKLIYQAMLG